MLIYSKQSQENMIGPLVPKRVKKPSNAVLKSESSNQRVVGIMLLPFRGAESGSSNKWTATTTTRNRAKNVNLVTETLNLIIILLLVSLYNSTIVDCQWPSEKVHHHHQGVSASDSTLKSAEARKVIGGSTGNGISTTGSSASYGNRISQMFASLGPRRDTPGQIAAQETIPSASFQLFDPAPSSPASSRNSAATANSQQLIGSEAHKGPPVYRSAPKQIIEVHEEPTKMKKRSSSKPSMIEVEISPKKIKKPKVLKVKKIKKKKKHSKKNVAASMVGPFHHHKKGKKHNYPSHYTYLGKYHEHRSVPSKGVWEFGYKRGNSKHTIEREEHGQKSHFKTEVKWKDKKGKGHHVFDYNHGDHKKKQQHHHAAAASQLTQKKEEPAIAAGLTLATKKKST